MAFTCLYKVEDILTTEIIKDYLHINNVEEKNLINSMLQASLNAAENYLRRSILGKTWHITYLPPLPHSIKISNLYTHRITNISLINHHYENNTIDKKIYNYNKLEGIISFKNQLYGEMSTAKHFDPLC
jgi:hypothetical protein